MITIINSENIIFICDENNQQPRSRKDKEHTYKKNNPIVIITNNRGPKIFLY